MPVTRITQLQIAVCVMTSIRRFVAAGHVRSLNRGRAELILCLQRFARIANFVPSYSFPLLFNRSRSIFATGSINQMKFVHNCSFDKNFSTRSWNILHVTTNFEEKNNTRIYDKLQLTSFIRYNSRNEEGGKNRKHNQICLMQAIEHKLSRVSEISARRLPSFSTRGAARRACGKNNSSVARGRRGGGDEGRAFV